MPSWCLENPERQAAIRGCRCATCEYRRAHRREYRRAWAQKKAADPAWVKQRRAQSRNFNRRRYGQDEEYTERRRAEARERGRRNRANPEWVARTNERRRAGRAVNPEPERRRQRERYYAMSSVEYNRELLRGRRRKALKRMEARNARSADG